MFKVLKTNIGSGEKYLGRSRSRSWSLKCKKMGGSGNTGKMNVLIPTGIILFALFHFSLLKSSAPLERGILLLLLLLKLFSAVAASGVQKMYVLKQTVNVSKTLSSLSINKKIMNCREECALGCRIL